MNRLLMLLCVCLPGLAACGQSGDLYRPEDRPPPQPEAAAPAADDDTQTGRDD